MGAHVTRFDGLADTYEKFRPGFPAAVFEALIGLAPADGPKLAIDVGAGVGLTAEGLLAATTPDWRVLAVEPGGDMRARCEARLAGESRAEVSAAAAEALPATDGAASVLLAARALHWFDLDAFFPEARRVLAPDGVMASLHSRIGASATIEAVERYFDAEGAGAHRRVARDFDSFAALRSAEGFAPPERVVVPFDLTLSTEALIGMFLSRSILRPVVERIGLDKIKAQLADVVAEVATGAESHRLDYDAVLAVCRRLA